MHIISFGLDSHAFDPKSVVASRMLRYGEIVDGFTIIIPTKEKKHLVLSPKVMVYGTGGANKPVRLLRVYRLARKLIKEGKGDVITTHDPYFMSLLGYMLARRYHLGFEVQILGVEKLNWIRDKILRFVLQRAGSIRVNSERLISRVVDGFNAPQERVRLVYIYVDVLSFGFNRKRTGEELRVYHDLIHAFREKYSSYVNFLYVGRLVNIKNIPLQVQALSRIVTRHPDVRLHIVGPDSEEHVADSLQTLINSLHLSDHVILHGPKYAEELGVFYSECDCFLLTSHSEGWGMVTIEAATAGLPIIMTDVGSAGEFVLDGVNGIVIPVDDVDALTSAMERIIQDPALRKQYAHASEKLLADLPTFEQLLDEYKASWVFAYTNRI